MSDFVSGFWNAYVVVIVLGSILACALLLYMQGKATFTPGKTMGHVWDETLEEFRGRVERNELSKYYDTTEEIETECLGICSNIS